MLRTYNKWWLLRNLKSDCAGHIGDQDIEALKKGLWLGVDKGAYLNTLSHLPFNKKLSPRELKIKVTDYDSMIESCIQDGYITLIPTPEKLSGSAIKVSYLGDDIVSYNGLITLLWEKCKGTWGLVAWLVTIAIAVFTTYVSTKK